MYGTSVGEARAEDGRDWRWVLGRVMWHLGAGKEVMDATVRRKGGG